MFGGKVESTEVVKHSLHPLKDGYFIDEVEITHTAGRDYWLGKSGSEQRTWLSSSWGEALAKAEQVMKH